MTAITIFGEVLFDCFDEGDKELNVLGGAPFNICWHLQALGDKPVFISRVGNDELGHQIIEKASNWGISVDAIQIDKSHPTGQVKVNFIDNEPDYDIKTNSAYDYIELGDLDELKQNLMPQNNDKPIFYHGSLALRSSVAKQIFQQSVSAEQWDIFLDVNLRQPWWDTVSLFKWIKQARWVKLNINELRELGFAHQDLQQAMLAFQQQFNNEQVIVTQGEEGVTVLAGNQFYACKPPQISHFIDTVGAGDAFTAVYMHGLVNDWPIDKTLQEAQAFAAKVIGIRGAIAKDKGFYTELMS
ncbi:PfkB family carbohydrate kinase [Thiomicrorhabdus sediminis]|uniref:Carbohydrate kinase n=1 Tax=Thiomicrorhabdus sediminis TaxID=2580412 RepID=A0A4P9K594_9GAMM|nr:PfkB family carbohydrate kinase [Thiomicrorhabdus sediminis]QCU89951.1 carbohydrate kinase [Thiomicrorhabdus sediminis]